MIASFIFWYLGCFEPPKNGQNRPIELLQKSKSCTNPPNSLQIPLFLPKFAACGLFWCRANSNHVFLTMTSHNIVKYCPNTTKLPKLSKNEYFMISCRFDVHWYFNQLGSGKMGAYLTTTVSTHTNAVKYCTNTAKWHILQPTKYFLAFFEFF